MKDSKLSLHDDNIDNMNKKSIVVQVTRAISDKIQKEISDMIKLIKMPKAYAAFKEAYPKSTIQVLRKYKEIIEKASIFYKERFSSSITKQRYDEICSQINDIDFDPETHYLSRHDPVAVVFCNGLSLRQPMRDIVKEMAIEEERKSGEKMDKQTREFLIRYGVKKERYRTNSARLFYDHSQDKVYLLIRNKLLTFLSETGDFSVNSIVHELCHGFDTIKYKKNQDKDIISSYITDKLRAPFDQGRAKNVVEKYYIKPQEIYARIMEIRCILGLRPGDVFDDAMFKKIAVIGDENIKDMLKLLDKKQGKHEFIELMNTIY